MKTIIAAGLMAMVSPAFAQSPAPIQWWTPTPQMVAKVETAMATHALPHPIALAERHYRGIVDKGRREIVAQYQWGSGSKPGLIIDQDGKGRMIMDGGCSVYNVWYDPASDKIIQAGCGGYA